MSKDLISIKCALISVSDKSGLGALAEELLKKNIKIISTGGTAKFLKNLDIPVTDVSSITNFPELMDGRLKTLHPSVHGGLLGLRNDKIHLNAMRKHNIPEIDLLVVDLYPFEKISGKKVSFAKIIENIDVGGPAMIRAAAKNHKYVTVLVDKEDYAVFLGELRENDGCTTGDFRMMLAEIAFARTAEYDGVISQWMNRNLKNKAPRRLIISGKIKQKLRYGENPHQMASYYQNTGLRDLLSYSKVHQGKELSFNNLNDLNSAIDVLREFEYEENAVAVIVKHSNTCGVAVRRNAFDAYEAAYNCDRSSAFGGVIAFNVNIDKKTAKAVCNLFAEVVIAPSADLDAVYEFSKKKNLRLITVNNEFLVQNNDFNLKQVSGGFLLQDRDVTRVTEEDTVVVSNKNPSLNEIRDMLFAWKVTKHIKSNAIVLAKDTATIGIGAGQMSRVDSTTIAIRKAEEMSKQVGYDQIMPFHSVAASDAFFPFADSIFKLAKAGISSVIQPGGSIKDKEVIDAVNELEMSMIFTRIRHFKH